MYLKYSASTPIEYLPAALYRLYICTTLVPHQPSTAIGCLLYPTAWAISIINKASASGLDQVHGICVIVSAKDNLLSALYKGKAPFFNFAISASLTARLLRGYGRGSCFKMTASAAASRWCRGNN